MICIVTPSKSFLIITKNMEIRLSPYNSPFIPAGHYPNTHWIGLEYQNQPHNSHVSFWLQSLPVYMRVYSDAEKGNLLGKTLRKIRNEFSDDDYDFLSSLFLDSGIKAAGRRIGLAD